MLLCSIRILWHALYSQCDRSAGFLHRSELKRELVSSKELRSREHRCLRAGPKGKKLCGLVHNLLTTM